MQHRRVSSVGITKLDGEVSADQPLQGYGQSWDAEGGLLPKWSVNISGMQLYVHFKKKNKAVQLVSNNIKEIKPFSEL